MKLSEIAQVFDLGSESGVTKTISRLGQRMENDAELLAEYNVLCQDLTPFGLYTIEVRKDIFYPAHAVGKLHPICLSRQVAYLSGTKILHT